LKHWIPGRTAGLPGMTNKSEFLKYLQNMIIDQISNISRYAGLSENIVKALSFIRVTDLQSLDKGRQDISGDDVYCIVDEYKTKSPDEGKLEAHRKYIDIQTVISGSEHIGYESLSDQEIIQAYDDEKDYALYRGKPSFIKLEPGSFAIFFPDDLHMPGINEHKTDVKKLVVKVRI